MFSFFQFLAIFFLINCNQIGQRFEKSICPFGYSQKNISFQCWKTGDFYINPHKKYIEYIDNVNAFYIYKKKFESENGSHKLKSILWTGNQVEFDLVFSEDKELAIHAKINLSPKLIDYEVCGNLHNMKDCDSKPICYTRLLITEKESIIQKKINCD